MADGSISVSDLYYGPVCSTEATLEIGVFLDANCNSYVPGLTRILNKRILSSLKGDTSRFHAYDLQNLYSYISVINQLNGDISSKEITYCDDGPQICQEVAEASVDLNSCRSLAAEITEASNSNYESNENDSRDGNFAENYGELVLSNDDDEGYRYQMYQYILEDYYYCIGTPSDDDGCSGWSYGWGNYDCIVANDDNRQTDCQQGFCYGLLESIEKGYTLSEWLASNGDMLHYEMTEVYKVGKPSVALLYGLLVTYIVMVAFLVAFAHWTRQILQRFSKRGGSRKMRGKKMPFLTKHHSNNSFGTARSSRAENSSPGRFRNSNAMLQLTPTKSNRSFARLPEMNRSERMEMIGYSRGKRDASIAFPPIDMGAI